MLDRQETYGRMKGSTPWAIAGSLDSPEFHHGFMVGYQATKLGYPGFWNIPENPCTELARGYALGRMKGAERNVLAG
jgi:hypothetical protein